MHFETVPRLDALLRYESLLHILGQRANRLDFADIMDSGKIFLARLAKGLIGKENAYLLGSLLVSRFHQTTIARQARSRDDRRPFFLIMDEAADLLTSTVSEILKGTRKYGLGLTLAHQTLDQLRRDDEVYGAVTGNCGIKVCFQVGGDDARKMAEEFGGFQATDLMNLQPRHAIARVGPRDDAFNLEVPFIPEADRPLDEAYEEVLERVRKFRGVLFSRQRPDGEAQRRRISSLDLRLRSNEARRPLARKPSGRRVFCPWPALARSLQPALGMLGPRRLGHSQNPSPQDPAQFSDTLLGETRQRYCTPRSEIRAQLSELRKAINAEARKDPFADLEAKRKKEKEAKTSGEADPEQHEPTVKTSPKKAPAKEERSSPPPAEEPGEKSPAPAKSLEQAKAESIKNQIIQASGSWGFDYETEKRVNKGTGHVDLVLTLGDLVIACEISATTRAEHEFERSVKKCLQAGFERIFVVCNAPKRRAKIQELVAVGCTVDEQRKVACVTVDEFLGRLSELVSARQAKQPAPASGSDLKETTTGLDVSGADRENATKKIWEDIKRRKKRDRGEQA